MEKMTLLSKLKELIEADVNIIEYLKSIDNSKQSSIQDIMISYELQAGSYIKLYDKNIEFKTLYCKSLSKIIEELLQNFNGKYTLLEAGIGEATTLAPLLLELQNKPSKIYGFDISWSRVKYARKFIKQLFVKDDIETFTADLFNIPLMDNSIDIVYTSHTIEPNGGKEEEALKELYRITNKYLILLEPAYELACEAARERMERHGYITKLYDTAVNLKYKIIEHRLLGININELNPTGLIIIEKETQTETQSGSNPYCCPWTKKEIKKEKGCYYSSESMLAYPIIDDIPCLLSQNAIIATKFQD